MARTPKSLAIQTIASSALTALDYVVPTSTTTSASLVLTNGTANTLDISVYINNGADDFLLVNRKIPAGIGKDWRVIEVTDLKLSAGFSVKVQATTSDSFNAFLSGSEVIDDALA